MSSIVRIPSISFAYGTATPVLEHARSATMAATVPLEKVSQYGYGHRKGIKLVGYIHNMYQRFHIDFSESDKVIAQ